MPKVILLHGSSSSDWTNDPDATKKSDQNWYPWLRGELQKRDILVFTPDMPQDWLPVYKDWKAEFEKLTVDEDTILIGHSAGGAFFVRWLGETKRNAKKLILVAPAKTFDPPLERLINLCDFEIDVSILGRVEKVVLFISDNESDELKKSARLYIKALGIEQTEIPNRGHFTLGDTPLNRKFPELLEEILEKR